MHEDLHDTVAFMDRLEVCGDYRVLVVILTVIADISSVCTGVQVPDDRIFRCRPSGERQGEDRIHFVYTRGRNGIYIYTATPDILATPKDGVAFAGREFLCINIALWGSRDNRYRQLIHTVATLYGRLTVIVNTIGGDVLTMPDQYLTLRPVF